MPHISIDVRTFRRIEKFAKQARISVNAAARDAVDSWMDLTSDPQIAVNALRIIAAAAAAQPSPKPHDGPDAEPCLPPNVIFINADHGGLPRPARRQRYKAPPWPLDSERRDGSALS